MSLVTQLSNLTTRIATECKSIRTLLNGNSSDLSSLTTTVKTNLVAAINELNAVVGSINSTAINDSSTNSLTETWSANKITAAISAAKNELTNGAGAALDTLAELAAALGNDSNFANTVTSALGYRVRFDAAQTLDTAQKTQACSNIGVGDPETNFVTIFNTGLV